MEKKIPKWVSLLYFIAAGLFFIAALVGLFGSLFENQHPITISVAFLCLGIAFLSIGIASRKKQKS
jgi:positive regulator of sigma E activity